MSNHVPTILIVGLFLSFFLRKYIHLDKYPIVVRLSLGMSILVIVVTVLVVFTDIGFTKQDYGWHVNHLDYENIHTYSTGKSQRIALIDTGVSEFQLRSNSKHLVTLVGNNQDNNGHGTMMYSIIKGYKQDILGIAPDAEIISIKVMNSDEKINPELMVRAIEKAIQLNSTVINFSIGSYKYNQAVSDMIDVAINKGITIVASSGDYSAADMMFPANKSGVISVGSISANNQISDFTNTPNQTTINAPGDEIKSIIPNGKIEFNSGTSQSTAIISGYVSLLRDYALQKHVNLSNDKIIKLLKSINDKKLTYVDAFSNLK